MPFAPAIADCGTILRRSGFTELEDGLLSAAVLGSASIFLLANLVATTSAWNPSFAQGCHKEDLLSTAPDSSLAHRSLGPKASRQSSVVITLPIWTNIRMPLCAHRHLTNAHPPGLLWRGRTWTWRSEGNWDRACMRTAESGGLLGKQSAMLKCSGHAM